MTICDMTIRGWNRAFPKEGWRDWRPVEFGRQDARTMGPRSDQPTTPVLLDAKFREYGGNKGKSRWKQIKDMIERELRGGEISRIGIG
jgi:hypothetical protein